jgi:CheY-like chemotaxis protein
VNVAQVLDELQHILSKTIPRNIGIQCTLTEGIWRLQADPTQLQQVLMNLCVNARDAMPTGGRIRISAENIQLDEHYVAMNIDARVGPYVKLVVEDDGDGIDPAILDRVFDPFFTTKPLGEGTGLGLATTLAIVKSHGGFIRLNSEVGKGTRFRIYLPANTSTTWQREQNVSEELPRGSGEVILVVDDEAAILEVTRLTLEEYGYQVEVATNGAEAVAVFAQNLNRIDLVLTDMMMPVMDGPATIQAVCRLRPGVPIIAASGVSQNNQIARSVGAGVQHFLSKPYTADVLLRKLAEVLARDSAPIN